MTSLPTLFSRSFGLVLLWTLLVFGCSVESLERQDQIRGLRILAIRAEPPEATPGTEITLSALVVTPKASVIRLRWLACKSPSQANQGCSASSDATELGDQETAKVTIPSDFFPAQPSLLQIFQGVYLPITLIAEADGQRLEAVKRIVVSLAPTNQNPEITDLSITEEGQTSTLPTPWQANAGRRYRLRPTVPDASRQRYPAITPDGELRETTEGLFFSWFSTDGLLQGRSSDETDPSQVWQAPNPASSAPSRLFIVLRDGRGGIVWQERMVSVLP